MVIWDFNAIYVKDPSLYEVWPAGLEELVGLHECDQDLFVVSAREFEFILMPER
jgi:hypothetical protein